MAALLEHEAAVWWVVSKVSWKAARLDVASAVWRAVWLAWYWEKKDAKMAAKSALSQERKLYKCVRQL